MVSERNKLVTIKIDAIQLSKTKIKENDYQLNEKLKMSLQAQGQLKTILVCEIGNDEYECLEGSKIVKCMKELNYNEVMAINVGVLSDEEKDIIKLQVMKDYFLVDYSLVGLMLKQMITKIPINKLCNLIPFDKRQVENLISLTKFDWEAFNLNKQLEGQMSLFGFDEKVNNESEKEQLPENVINQFIENQKDLEVEYQEIITENFFELIDNKVDKEIKKSTDIEVEKNMSILNEPVNEKPIELIIEINKIENNFISDNEVKHEYAHIVYFEDGQYKMMPERQYFDIGKKHEQLFRNTFSNCRLFISHKNNQQPTLL